MATAGLDEGALASKRVSVAGSVAVTTAVALAVSQAFQYATLSHFTGEISAARLYAPMLAAVLGVFVACFLVRADDTFAGRVLGAFLAVATGSLLAVVSAVPLGLASVGIYRWLGLLNSSALAMLGAPLLVLGLVFTNRRTVPSRLTVLTVGLAASAVVVLVGVFSELAIGPVTFGGVFSVWALPSALASNPVFALAFGFGAGLGSLWPPRRRVPHGPPNA